MPVKSVEEMSVDEIRKEILSWLYEIAHFLSKDTATFFFMKSVPGSESMRAVGGGNFPIALGCFSLIELYSGVYSNLTDGEGLWTDKDKVEYEETINQIIKLGISKSKIDIISKPEPKPGSIKNACITVNKLLKSLEKEGLITGLPINDFKAFCAIWSAFRNNMAHTFSPAMGTVINSASHEDIKKLIPSPDKFLNKFYLQVKENFSIENHDGEWCWVFSAEHFAVSFNIATANIIRKKIKNEQSEGKLKAILIFLRGQEFDVRFRIPFKQATTSSL